MSFENNTGLVAEIKNKKRSYTPEQRERRNEIAREYSRRNRAKITLKTKLWRLKNPDKYQEQCRRQNAKRSKNLLVYVLDTNRVIKRRLNTKWNQLVFNYSGPIYLKERIDKQGLVRAFHRNGYGVKTKHTNHGYRIERVSE